MSFRWLGLFIHIPPLRPPVSLREWPCTSGQVWDRPAAQRSLSGRHSSEGRDTAVRSLAPPVPG